MRALPLTAVAIATVLVLGAAACEAARENATTTAPSASAPRPPIELPAGIPASFEHDVPASDLPVRALVPPGTEVTDRLVAATVGGDAVVLVYAERGGEAFRRAKGFVIWRRDEGASPPWRAVFGMTHPRRDHVLAIQGLTGDATGDGSADLLLFETTGGVGNCGNWRVIDLASGRERWHRSTCDTQVDLTLDPPGLVLTEMIYEPSDPHCCPSAIRTRTLAYRSSGRFATTSQETVPFTPG